MSSDYTASMFVNNAPTPEPLSISRGVFFCLILPLAIGFELTMLTTGFTGKGRELHLVLLGVGVFGRLINIGVSDGVASTILGIAAVAMFMIEVTILKSLSQDMVDMATAIRGPFYILMYVAFFVIGFIPGKSERS